MNRQGRQDRQGGAEIPEARTERRDNRQGRQDRQGRTESPESRVQNCGAIRPKPCAEAIKAAGFAGCGLRKCPFRKQDRDRIAWNGKVKGDTIRRASRQMGDGRQLFAEMPRGAFYVEDRKSRRIIFAGKGLGEMYLVLFRNLEGGEGSHRLRIKGTEPRTSLSGAMHDLWQWCRGKQGPGLVVVEGELD